MIAPDTDTLHAYADGRLSPERAAEIERWLGDHPEAAAEIAAWQRQNDALNALFPRVRDEVPARLRPAAIAAGIVTARRSAFRNIAAALILLLLGSGIGWYGRDYLTATTASDRLIGQALTAHTLYSREKTRAVEVAAGATSLMSWLGDRTGTSIDAPDLEAEGYMFLGGRLLPAAPGEPVPAAAQLMYEDAGARRLTLYITTALPDGREAWEFTEQNGVSAYYWANAEVTCTIVASLPEDELRALGRKIFQQLTRRPETSLGEW